MFSERLKGENKDIFGNEHLFLEKNSKYDIMFIIILEGEISWQRML